jgi:hypothetical protein
MKNQENIYSTANSYDGIYSNKRNYNGQVGIARVAKNLLNK